MQQKNKREDEGKHHARVRPVGNCFIPAAGALSR
jgi:hypothetical protein